MLPTHRNTLVLVLAFVVALVGLIDAAAAPDWDMVAVFGLLALLQLLLGCQLLARRPLVPLRRDLVIWLIDRSAATGDPVGHIADRCVAAYQAGLVEAEAASER